jgi:hypothetical protein
MQHDGYQILGVLARSRPHDLKLEHVRVADHPTCMFSWPFCISRYSVISIKLLSVNFSRRTAGAGLAVLGGHPKFYWDVALLNFSVGLAIVETPEKSLSYSSIIGRALLRAKQSLDDRNPPP